MKILLVNNFFSRKGGAESVFLNTIDLLKRKGHSVVTLSIKESERDIDGDGHYFIDTSKTLHNKFYSFESRKKIKAILDLEKPQLAHIHNIIGRISFSILPVIRTYGIPVVSTIHDFRLLCPTYAFLDRNNKICEKCIGGKYYNCTLNNCSPRGYFRSALLTLESYLRDLLTPYQKMIDNFIFVSSFYKNKFGQNVPEIMPKAKLIYNFSEKFDKTNNRGEYFLFFGRLTEIKGIKTLLNAVGMCPSIRFIIAGDGDLADYIKLKNYANVETVGFKSGSELEMLIKGSMFVLVPSEWLENNPMTIIEAFAFGKPVIASRIGGISELVSDGETGFLFEKGDWQELKEAIIKSSELSTSGYIKMQEKCFEFAERHFKADMHYEKLLETYNEAISKK